MKKIVSSLMPLAVLALFLSCLASIFSLLVVLMTSAGFADGVPWSYYQKLNIGVISVALPIVGMILFGVILVGLTRKPAEALKPAVIESDINLPTNEEKEERLPKAA
jgi:TRAP-type C4-dicarboxylate transport system permease small subunit